MHAMTIESARQRKRITTPTHEHPDTPEPSSSRLRVHPSTAPTRSPSPPLPRAARCPTLTAPPDPLPHAPPTPTRDHHLETITRRPLPGGRVAWCQTVAVVDLPTATDGIGNGIRERQIGQSESESLLCRVTSEVDEWTPPEATAFQAQVPGRLQVGRDGTFRHGAASKAVAPNDVRTTFSNAFASAVGSGCRFGRRRYASRLIASAPGGVCVPRHDRRPSWPILGRRSTLPLAWSMRPTGRWNSRTRTPRAEAS